MTETREPRKDWARLVELARNDPGEWVFVGKYKNERTMLERARQVKLYYGVEVSVWMNILKIRYTSNVMPSLERESWNAPVQSRPHIWWEQVISRAQEKRGEFVFAGSYSSIGSAKSAGYRARKKWEHLGLKFETGKAEPHDLYVMIPALRFEDTKEYLEGFLPKLGPLTPPDEDAEPS